MLEAPGVSGLMANTVKEMSEARTKGGCEGAGSWRSCKQGFSGEPEGPSLNGSTRPQILVVEHHLITSPHLQGSGPSCGS